LIETKDILIQFTWPCIAKCPRFYRVKLYTRCRQKRMHGYLKTIESI